MTTTSAVRAVVVEGGVEDKVARVGSPVDGGGGSILARFLPLPPSVSLSSPSRSIASAWEASARMRRTSGLQPSLLATALLPSMLLLLLLLLLQLLLLLPPLLLLLLLPLLV